jgi:hypothetical protein
MVRIKAHFDGKVLIPDEPIELPSGVSLDVTVETSHSSGENDSLASLIGLGADVWKGVDPVEYQRREREGWE